MNKKKHLIFFSWNVFSSTHTVYSLINPLKDNLLPSDNQITKYKKSTYNVKNYRMQIQLDQMDFVCIVNNIFRNIFPEKIHNEKFWNNPSFNVGYCRKQMKIYLSGSKITDFYWGVKKDNMDKKYDLFHCIGRSAGHH